MQLSELYEISERQINALKSAHIETEQDLLCVYPKRYYDMNNIGSLNKAADGSRLGIVGILKSIKTHVTRAGDRMTVATVTDKNSGNILRVNWLREPYRFNMYSHMIGQEIYVLGKISYQESMDSYSLFSPTIFRVCDTNLGIYSEYSPVRGISDENFKVCLGIALKHYNKEETLPEELLKKYKLYGLKGAYRAIHFPTDLQDIINAKKRLIFDDLLFFALLLVESEKKMSQGTGFVLRSLTMMRNMERDLPFQLTEGHGQKDVLESILSDMRSGKRVDAMVQGDVGCGKTIVAFLLMFAIAENGGQCVLMASSMVLGKQHYDDIKKYAEKYGVSVEYLDSSVTGKKKKRIIEQVRNGEVSILVGTQSVLGKEVEFFNLALVVMDEEHKYGVLQREALIDKGGTGVHVISMSATPIPRSLAVTIFSEQRKLYNIERLPSNRKKVKTAIYQKELPIMKFMEAELRKGHQAYVICPLVEREDGHSEDVESVDVVLKKYSDYFESRGFKVDCLTGKTKKKEAENVIEKFYKNETQILVATTVVEVGINIPNATVIVVNNAERFGMSSLHQLRGRVGRGSDQAFCILKSDDTTNMRLRAIAASTNGFEIAEEDCKLRGVGNLVGIEQTGKNKYLMLAMRYPKMFAKIRQIAERLYENGQSQNFIERYMEERYVKR